MLSTFDVGIDEITQMIKEIYDSGEILDLYS